VCGGLEKELKSACAERDELRERLAEISEDASEQRRLRMEIESETNKRADQVLRNTIGRLMKQGISRAFNQWVAAHEETTYRKQLLLRAGSRLANPLLVSCIAAWKASWKASLVSVHEMELQDIVAEKAKIETERDRAAEQLEWAERRVQAMEKERDEHRRTDAANLAQLRRLTREQEAFEVALQMEHIALEDERQKSTSLQSALDEALAQARASSKAERDARDLVSEAKRDAALAEERCVVLEQAASASISREPEQRLQALLAEQRANLEANAQRARQEAMGRIETLNSDTVDLNARIAELEAELEEREQLLLTELRAAGKTFVRGYSVVARSDKERTRSVSSLVPASAPPDPRRSAGEAKTNFKPFTFHSDDRAAQRAAMKHAEEEKRRLVEDQERMKQVAFKFASKMRQKSVVFANSPEMRAQMRDEMVCRAVLKLQAAIRGRIARSKMAVRRGSIP